MQTRHPAVSRRALGVHNTSCDINSLYEDPTLLRAIQEIDPSQDIRMSQDMAIATN